MKKLFKFFTSEALIIFLILVFAFILRAPFFNEPLDYDEGTYAFFAFFSKGEKFYSSLPIGRLPGIIFTYWFFIGERLNPSKIRYWKRFIEKGEDYKKPFMILKKIDEIFLKIPFLRRYCWNTVIELVK